MNIDEISKRTCRSLEWERLKTFLAHEADSTPGKQACQAVEPASGRLVVERLLHETDEAVSLLEARAALTAVGLPDLVDIIGRLQTGAALSGKELVAVKTTLGLARQSKSSIGLLPPESFPRLREFLPRIHAVKNVFREIDGSLDDIGEVKDEASTALRSLRRDVHRIDNSIKDELTRIIHSTTLSKALQESIFTQRNGRYVLPVNANMRSQINGIVHDSSASGLTVYIEPLAVVELANKMRIKEAEIEHEIARILQELSSIASQHHVEIASSYETLVELDVIIARARLALRYGGTMPELSADRRFTYIQARHPLLVLQTSIKDVVANDIALGGMGESGRTLVITGPNTGGKTVLLKTVGLFALMVRAGMLPAANKGSVAAIFDRVCADIGDEQSLEQSLSTFSSHMQNIVEIVNNADDGMLVLLDEVGAGTDPREGAALARAVLERLNDSGAVTITTTHYGELKTMAYTEAGFVNGSLDFDENTLSPTYRLRLGVPGSSKATTIARRLGLDERVVQRARDLMQSSEQDLERLIDQLERKLLEVDEREQLATRALREAQELKASAEAQVEELSVDAQKKRARLAAEMEEEFKLSRDYIKHLIADLQKQPSMNKAQKAKEDLEKLRKELGWNEQQRNAGAPQIEVGQRVRVRTAGGQTAIVESITGVAGGANRQATVKVGSLKIKVPLADLEHINGGAGANQRADAKSAARSGLKSYGQKTGQPSSRTYQSSLSSGPMPFIRTGSNTIDVRGERVDDALLKVEQFLDNSLVAGLPIVMIIHGHGTGAVRNAVRNLLSDSDYAKLFRPGEDHEGGNGVTIVTLQ